MSTIETIVVVTLAMMFLTTVAALLLLMAGSRSVCRVMSEQHRSLMGFHAAGQSLAAHELERARIDLAMRQADASKAMAETRRAELQVDHAASVEIGRNGKVRGRFGEGADIVGNGDHLDRV